VITIKHYLAANQRFSTKMISQGRVGTQSTPCCPLSCSTNCLIFYHTKGAHD